MTEIVDGALAATSVSVRSKRTESVLISSKLTLFSTTKLTDALKDSAATCFSTGAIILIVEDCRVGRKTALL